MVHQVSVDSYGKTAFITGGGSGIGRGLALRMAQRGAHVVVTDVDGEAAGRVASEIEQAGGTSVAKRLDVIDADATATAVAEAIQHFGGIDYVFANAGVLGPADLTETTPADWSLVLDVNVKGVINTCQAVTPHMMERKQGRILITASYNGVRAGTHVIPYRVSKAAILMYTRCLALFLAPYGVTVNAICPGVTLTPMQLDYAAATALAAGITTEDYLAERRSAIPMQQFTEIEDLTNLAAFLVADDARLITGQAIAPDGGMLASS
ncbi:MAG: SDR family oxidoreductase [Caldilineales bacterium]|nr:SDR family oxidoreductase [Caldilineales bacterium]